MAKYNINCSINAVSSELTSVAVLKSRGEKGVTSQQPFCVDNKVVSAIIEADDEKQAMEIFLEKISNAISK